MIGSFARAWSFNIPTQFIFGWGCLNDLASYTNKFGDRVLLVTGKNAMRQTGVLNRVEGLFETAGIKVSLFDGISENPKTKEIDAAVALGKKDSVTVVVGLGGGSAVDAAKAIGVCLAYDQPVDDFLTGDISPEKSLPVIAVPTTAGTGSALSKGAIVTDSERKFKGGIRGEVLFPVAAIVDPEMLKSVPNDVKNTTAFDVLTHAIETYLSKKATPITQALSREVFNIIRVAKLTPLQPPSSSDIDEGMAYASNLMGINLGNAGTCLPHRIQYSIGALTDTPHAEGLAALYPAWIHLLNEKAPEKAKEVFDLILPNRPSNEPATTTITTILKDFDMEITVHDLGVQSPDQLEWCIEHVTGDLADDPAWEDDTTVRKLLSHAFAQ
jgi:alcohol dehydrogenase class IV